MTTDGNVDTALWDEFHHVVNMTSRELQEWLRTMSADEESEKVPDQAGPEIGQRVLEILRKRRTDLTPDDGEVMRKVVDRVHNEHGDEEPTGARPSWRRRLMAVGHDPLKPMR